MMSKPAYAGALGTTSKVLTFVRDTPKPVLLFESIDVGSDPELAKQFLVDGDSWFTVERDGERVPLAHSVVYHDAARGLFVLVIAPALAHRELAERSQLLARLAAERVELPNYVRDFDTVIGVRGLAKRIAASAAAVERERELVEREKNVRTEADQLAKKLAALSEREQGSAKQLAALREQEEKLSKDLAAKKAELDRASQELERQQREYKRLDDARRQIESQQAATVVDSQIVSEVPADRTEATERQPKVEATPSRPIRALSPMFEPAHSPTVTDSYSSECEEFDLASAPSWLRAASERKSDRFVTTLDTSGSVHLVLSVLPSSPIASAPLDVKVVMARLPQYPVIVLAFGAQRDGINAHRALATFDVSNELDAQILSALANRFTLDVAVVTPGGDASDIVSRVWKLTAPFGENIGYMLRSAREDVAALPAEKRAAGYVAARHQILQPGFDLLGYNHPEFAEFREDKLRSLGTASAVRRALAIAKRFAKPSREDYIVCTRGYPLTQWRTLRKELLAAAVGFGLWMGPELAQIAVSEGLARSRRDLVVRLDAGFAILRKNIEAFDLDDDAASDNLAALTEEANARGVTLRKAGVERSEDGMATAGSIEGRAPVISTKSKTTTELIAMLDDRSARVAAAIALCERGEGKAAPAVIAAVRKMNRSEAVRVLGMSVRFGLAAAPALQEGLGNSKSYLRHGCALALAMLRSEDGTTAVIELLLREPTEIWREIARAIGQIGTFALGPLAAKLGSLGDHIDASARERAAWAMAHVAVRGGKAALTTMANGHSVVAPVAARALELVPLAARDQVRVAPDATGSQPGREVTVNRAFSRRFFESLDVATPAAQPAVVDVDAAGGAVEVVGDDDIIIDSELLDDEDAQELSDADLISQ